MKISQLVEKFETLQNDHGDLFVEIHVGNKEILLNESAIEKVSVGNNDIVVIEISSEWGAL
jgi:hypothetical protein